MSKGTKKRYDDAFRRRAVEMMLQSGKTVAQTARELGVSAFSLNLWKKRALADMTPQQVDGNPVSPEDAFKEIRRLHKENEYLRRQREILKKAMSILGEESAPGMR
jgi:transposase-like protein